MKRGAVFVALLVVTFPVCGAVPVEGGRADGSTITSPSGTVLPEPDRAGGMTLAATLAARRSVRSFAVEALTERQISQLLWAAQGRTDGPRHRTAPSAGALYPLEIYLVLPGGIHHYEPEGHRLTRLSEGDARGALHRAALSQDAVREAPAVFVIAAVYARTEVKYGRDRTPRYVHMEAGHAAQNLLLEATALGLGAVPIGAFEDARVKAALALPTNNEPLYLIPVGKAR